MHAGDLTREGLRSVPTIAYGKRARSLVDFWNKAADWDWADRIEYLPGT
jgi:hypothetical protein